MAGLVRRQANRGDLGARSVRPRLLFGGEGPAHFDEIVVAMYWLESVYYGRACDDL